jgi:uncharacterized protein (TIGR02996 family)
MGSVIAHSALEAALRQDMRDEASWAVYADWLSNEGDSRGELIGYEQRADRETDPALTEQWRRRAKQLFERDHQHWLGPLRKANMDPTWMRGFVTEAVVHNRPNWTASTLLSTRTGALLYRLGFTRLPDCRPVADALRNSWIDVVELRNIDTTKIEPLADIVGLRELFIHGCKIEDFATLAKLPALARVIVHDSELDLRAFESGFATLRHLVLSDHGYRPRPARGPVELSGLAQLPALEILDLRGSLVRDLGPLARLSRLRQLDITDTDVRSLAPLEGLGTLERVDAHGIHRPSDAECERLRARGVLVETQDPSSRVGP